IPPSPTPSSTAWYTTRTGSSSRERACARLPPSVRNLTPSPSNELMTTPTREQWPAGGRDHRNPWPASIGLGGRLHSESPADFVGMRTENNEAPFVDSPKYRSRSRRLSAEMHEATRSTSKPQALDNTDWLKTLAIVAVSVGHIGYFFLEDDLWWSVFGRLAAPTLFFFIGYAQTRTVPTHWIWLGFALTLLES